MNVRTAYVEVLTRCERFLLPPADAHVLSALRIGYALLILVYFGLMFPHVATFWSDAGVLPLANLRDVAQGFVPTLFYLLPRSSSSVWVGYALLITHTVLLLVGYRAKLQAALLLIWLVSFQNRNPLVVNGQDAVLRWIGFWLLFLPISQAWALRARAPRPGTPTWPLRLLQVQIAIIMLAAGLWKLTGDDWTNGTALYYVTALRGFWGNLPLPSGLVASAEVLRFLTHATLAFELAIPILIWVPKLRRIALASAVLFHVALAYAMNLFLFPWIMILGWCSFLKAEDIAWLRKPWFTRFRTPQQLRLQRYAKVGWDGENDETNDNDSQRMLNPGR